MGSSNLEGENTTLELEETRPTKWGGDWCASTITRLKWVILKIHPKVSSSLNEERSNVVGRVLEDPP